MHQAVQYAAFAIETPYSQIKVPRIGMLIASPHGPSEQVRDLNQTGRGRVGKQWHLRHVTQGAPSCAPLSELLGEALQCLLVTRLVHDDQAPLLVVVAPETR